jgi:hypothetical protein
MRKTYFSDIPKYIDLYYNDSESLKKSFKKFKLQNISEDILATKNS